MEGVLPMGRGLAPGDDPVGHASSMDYQRALGQGQGTTESEDEPAPGSSLEREGSSVERAGAAYSIKAIRGHDYSGQEQPSYANGRVMGS